MIYLQLNMPALSFQKHIADLSGILYLFFMETTVGCTGGFPTHRGVVVPSAVVGFTVNGE